MDAGERFWTWFLLHQMDLYRCDNDDDAIFDELASELRSVNPDLTYECGPKAPKRQLVISAGGLERSFPAVTALVGAAPELSHWSVVAFMPRGLLPVSIDFQGVCIDSADVQFSLLDNGKTAGIHLFIPNFREENLALQQIGYMLLDHVLGEFDVETKVGLIRMLAPDTQTRFARHALSELPSRFDRLIHRLEGSQRR